MENKATHGKGDRLKEIQVEKETKRARWNNTHWVIFKH